jgi:Ca2+-transporting ATPase
MADRASERWHNLRPDEAARLLGVDAGKGLPEAEARRRAEEHGPNEITAHVGPSWVSRLLDQFNQPLIYILLASALVAGLLREWVDCGVILGVVALNAAIGFIQETKAIQALDALARVMTTEATVVRQGQARRVPASELVPGDIVNVEAGDKVPADLRVFSCVDLRVDESTLTGESVPVQKGSEVLERDTQVAERTNMMFASTLVTSGRGVAAVVGTGDNTEIGRVSQHIAHASALDTPLTKKIAQFSRVVLVAILVLAAVAFAVGLVRGQTVGEMLMASVALAVGAIPEGLPAAVTITLAIGVGRMARRRAIVRRLPAVETLGSTTVICTDKTGTLTENKMTVRQLHAGGSKYSLTGRGYEPVGEVRVEGRPPADPSVEGAPVGDTRAAVTVPVVVEELLRAGALCNDAVLQEEEGDWHIHGDPTEGALLVSAAKAGIDLGRLSVDYPRLDSVPFASGRRYMATLHLAPEGLSVAFVKGSVEALLPRCARMMAGDGGLVPLDGEVVEQALEMMASEGLRVLACARKEFGPEVTHLEEEDVGGGLIFLGLQGMLDPARAEAAAAVRACREAGLMVKMITGDHAATAAAVAHRVGIMDERVDTVLSYHEIEALGDTELEDAALEARVFARVSPEQKLRLVEALQARGQVVAMTGDGVNDAAALRRADIGVAMGMAGTDVAREAADMVLTDDNFATIEAAVEEGRGVFDNLVKFITWTLPTNLGEGLVILAAVLVGATLPILPVQILWINMTTAVFIGLGLAFEEKEAGIMTRPPRSPNMPLLTRELVVRIILVGALLLAASFGLFAVMSERTTLAEARTVAVNVFVVVQLFYLFNCRTLAGAAQGPRFFSNPWLWGGVTIMVVLQALFTYAPFMNRVFLTSPIGLPEWGLILAVGVVAYVVVAAEKAVTARSRRRAGVDGEVTA